MKFEYASGSRPLDGFTIKRGVGIGGFGEVYFALSDAGKEVALKRVKRNLDVEVRGVSQCLNLKHINLIGLFDIKYDDEGGAWVVMEYVGGESLGDVIERNQNGMPIEEVLRWFHGIAAGVTYLHDHGIVHRDLKPGNIFCDEDTIKIGDYGLSKFISCSRRSGQTESVGTCHYMAPEIGKGVYGKEIDIYALGIILFEMMMGRLPFEGESSQEIIMKHLTAEPELSDVPQPYRSIIRKALFKDPARRFRSVPEMVSSLSTETSGAVTPEPTTNPGIVTSHMAADPELPPIITKPVPVAGDPIYISDDTPEEIVFGPVRNVPPSQQKVHQPRPQVGGRATRSMAVATPVGSAVHRPEPIAIAVRDGWGSLAHWWTNSTLSSPLKVILLFAAAFALAVNAAIFVPVAVALGAVYLIYYGIRAMTIAGGNHISARRNRRETIEQGCRDAIRRRPIVQTFAELTGSLLTSSVVAGVLVLVMLIIGDEAFRDIGGSREASRFGWLTAVSIFASWIILTISKIWERSGGDSAKRRMTMAVLGTLMGLAAFGLAVYLKVTLPANAELDAHIVPREFQDSLLTSGGSPTLLGHILFFGGLFAILRWWRQADPLRTTRLSLIGTAVCVLWAWIIPYSQPWGFMVALALSVAIQLSAPWFNQTTRNQLASQS